MMLQFFFWWNSVSQCTSQWNLQWSAIKWSFFVCWKVISVDAKLNFSFRFLEMWNTTQSTWFTVKNNIYFLLFTNSVVLRMKLSFIGKILILSQPIIKETQSKVYLSIKCVLYWYDLFVHINVWEPNNYSLNCSLTFLGRDAAFIGPNENQFAILDEDKTGLALYILPGGASKEAGEKNLLVEENQAVEANAGSIRGPMQFMFESEIDRIFSTPIGAWGNDILCIYCCIH